MPQFFERPVIVDAPVIVSEFTAVTDCPKCGHIATHWIDSPKPPPTDKEWREYGQAFLEWQQEPYEDDGYEVKAWQGGTMKVIPPRKKKPSPRPPVDETGNTLMRVCRVCEHRWGQK